ncbi:chlorhexidine efflux transporter [Pseudoalteromonas sp. KJ10-2]|uniref:chlorhexidine efflux transporter n=1 Tax=Psychromonas sp. KJ10-2 TaxID=3391822 RepID=UPI0039B6651D
MSYQCRFQGVLLIAIIPVIAYLLGVSLCQALMMNIGVDIGVTIFITIYAFFYNLT